MLRFFVRFFVTIASTVLLFLVFASILFENQYEKAMTSEYLLASKAVNKLMDMRFCEHDKSLWQYDIAEISAQYGYSIVITQLAALSSKEKEELATRGVVARVNSGFIRDRVQIGYSSACHDSITLYSPISSLSSDYNLFFFLLLVFVIFGVGAAVLSLAWPILKYINILVEASEAIARGVFSQLDESSFPTPLDRLAIAINRSTRTIGGLVSEQEILTSSASHEFRTPITRLRFSIDIADRITSLESLKSHVSDMVTDIEQLEQLVSELMVYSKFSFHGVELQRENFAVFEILEAIKQRMRLLKPEVAIRVNCPKATQVNGSAKSIERAITNLVANGQKYGRTEVWIDVLTREDVVVIRVSDDGDAIPEKHRKDVLQPFYRIDNSRSRETGGYGLGLAIVNKIVSMHGGNISVLENEKGGTTVQLEFPC